MKEDIGMSKPQKACKQGWEANIVTKINKPRPYIVTKINKPRPYNPTVHLFIFCFTAV